MMSRQLPFGGSSLVATSSFKLKVQRAFHSLAIQHQINQFHTAIHTCTKFTFYRIYIGKRMLPFFLYSSLICFSFQQLLFPLFFAIFVGAFCNIDKIDLIKQNSSPILIVSKPKRILTKIQNLKLEIPIFYGLPPISCSVLSP